jgi:hypothetical protein
MGAYVDPVQLYTIPCQFTLHERVNFVKVFRRHKSPRNAALIGHDHQAKSQGAQPSQTFNST